MKTLPFLLAATAISMGACSGSHNATGSGGSAASGTGANATSGTGTNATTGPGSPTTTGAGGAGPVTPTISSWLGTNISADLPRVDITFQMSPFDTGGGPKDASGYPAAGVNGKSTTDLGFLLPSGAYKIQYKGTGSVTVSGIATLTGSWTTANGEQRATIDIAGSHGNFGQMLTVTITNGPGQTVTDLRILSPGFDYDTTEVFLPQFLAALAPFRAMRFMDWEATNNSTISDWADHATTAHFGHAGPGEPIEHIIALINKTGKDAWITIPEHATDDYVQKLAKAFGDGLDFTAIDNARKAQGYTTPFQLMFEVANETWNGGFSAKNTLLAIANSNAARYDGTYGGTFGPSWMTSDHNLVKVAQVEGDLLAHDLAIIKTELGSAGHGDAVKAVLSGWALGPGYTDPALRFIQANYGDAKQYVSYVAIAPYFATADDSTTGSLAQIFPAMVANIDSMEPALTDFATLSTMYGIPIAAYEGGQGLSGSTNLTIKHLAQFDVRMYDTYNHYADVWKKHFGKSLFMHFSLTGDPGIPESFFQYGFWWSLPSVLTDLKSCGMSLPTLTGSETPANEAQYCPKYRALAEHVPD